MRFPRLIFAAFCAFLPLSLPAHTVSFIVGETGLSPEIPRVEASLRWESGFMDTFFEAGHIVSNAPIVRMGQPETGFPPEFRADLGDAREGGVDYLILILLDYRNWRGEGAPKPSGASLRLFQVTPLRLVAEIPFPGQGRSLDGDEFSNARQAAGLVLPRLQGVER